MCAGSASARADGLGIVRVAHFDAPVYATSAPGEPGRLYVVQQAGQIVVLEAGHIRSTPFLDIKPIVLSGGEQGLLSVAFDPDYAKTHRFYVDYTDRNGDTHVVGYRSNGVTAIPSSARQLLFVKDFASNHNGGQLQFGPDGWLYWGNGDGGGGGDPQHNGQNLNRPFAKIMRLDINAAKPRWKLVAFVLRIPGGFHSTARTAICTSVTSARISGKRSTTCAAAPVSPTSAGTTSRRRTRSTHRRNCWGTGPTTPRSPSTHTPAAAAP
jgi:glucose/arabinose dehydrogenase